MATVDTAESADKAPEKIYSKKDVEDALVTIAKKVVESHAGFVHSMIFLDHLLRLPNARDLFDKDLKNQARDLWLKVKSAGFQLNDPPILFDGNERGEAN